MADLDLLANIRLQTRYALLNGTVVLNNNPIHILVGWFLSLVYFRAVRLFGWRHLS